MIDWLVNEVFGFDWTEAEVRDFIRRHVENHKCEPENCTMVIYMLNGVQAAREHELHVRDNR